MNKSVAWNIVLAIALAVSLTANVVTWILWPKEQEDVPVIDSTQTTLTQTTTTTAPPIQKVMMAIETPYGTLQYPAEYVDHLFYEAVEENGEFMQVFSYHYGEETIEMFRVHFAVGDVPAPLGTVKHDGGEIAVGVSSTEFIPDESWSDDDEHRFRAMTMAINDVIASVQAWDDYVG